MYTQTVERPRSLRKRHSVVTQWDLLTPIGIAEPTPSTFPVEMPPDADAATRVASWLDTEGVTASDRVVVVHVSASSPFRRWPLPAFVQTVVALASRPRCYVAVTAGPSDRGAVDHIIDAARAEIDQAARTRILTCDHFSLPELRALIERGAVYIGGDSGPLHIAATTSTPIVALFGPTPSERSAPWRHSAFPAALMEVNGLECRPCDQRVCTPGDFRCLTWIQPMDVIAAAERFLADAPHGQRRSS
jgi:ADP-heptose:LPS heptosyltransferase